MIKVTYSNIRYQTYKSDPKLHYLWVLLPLIVAGGLYASSYFIFHSLPDPLENGTGSNSGKFVESYARNNLKEFTSIGPRLVGSIANEIQAINFLIDSVEKIKMTAASKYNIEYEVQIADFGSYIFDDMVDIYKSIKNFVVRLSSAEQKSNATLLINSHFDTVPESAGAGDDATMVVVMLEVLRVLSTSINTLKHPIIFLFNGAEENSMQGSHAFITQHRWAKDIKAFINLDAAGLGGKEILFQSGPEHPWLVQHYHKSAIRPYGTTIAEEVFQKKLIPSDTDFRVFRDYGKIPGLDLAHGYNGFVYHTKLDRFSSITKYGSLQNTGDNVLALVTSIVSSKELENPDDYAEGHTVFFDFLGLFLIFYTEAIGTAINLSVVVIALTAVLFSIYSMSRNLKLSLGYILKKMILILFMQMATLTLAAGVSILIAVIIDEANAPLFWFSQNWLIFGIYICPYCFVAATVPTLYLTWRESDIPLRYGIQLFNHSHCIILILLAIATTCLSIRSSFAITIGIIFYTLSVIINWATGLQSRAFSWLIPVLALQIIPFLFFSYLSQQLFTLFIPIAGRSGCTSQPEITISGCAIIIAVMTTGFLAPLFGILRKSKTVILGFLVVFVAFAIILATPLAFPFTKDVAAERHWVFHTERSYYDINGTMTRNDSGYILIPLDRYFPTTIKDIISDTNYTRTGKDCSEMLYCGVPVYISKFKPLSNYSYWIPAERPVIPNEYKAGISLLNKTAISESTFRYSFEIAGPAHLQIFFNPLNQSQLVSWSVCDEFPTKKFFKESTYFLTFRNGIDSNSFQFYLDFKVPENYEGAVFDIALAAHHTNYEVTHTKEFKQFLSRYPDWVTLTPIVSSYIGLRF